MFLGTSNQFKHRGISSMQSQKLFVLMEGRLHVHWNFHFMAFSHIQHFNHMNETYAEGLAYMKVQSTDLNIKGIKT
jgi:hypothetical protein